MDNFPTYQASICSNDRRVTVIMAPLIVLAMMASLLLTPPVWGQSGNYPANGYYGLLGENSVYHSGDLRDAERLAEILFRGAYREGNVRWIDSMAYLSLLGEIRYQGGDYPGALQALDEAAAIYGNMIQWPARVSWDAQPVQLNNNAATVARITWGAPTRQTQLGRFPTGFPVRFGQNIVVPGDQGNTVIPQERLVTVDTIEMYRAMALAIHRRDDILGTLSQVDPTSRQLRAQLNDARGISPSPIPVTMGSILYGISVAGESDYKKSNEILTANLQINGLDHPLTPVALFQIGYNQWMAGDFKAAKVTLGEASFSAAYFEQFDVFRESLMLAAKAHTAVNRDQPFPELALAAEWARTRGLRMAQFQFALASAENEIENGQIAVAAVQLEAAAKLVRTTDLKRSVHAARLVLLERVIGMISGQGYDLAAFRRDLQAYRQLTPWNYRVQLLASPNNRKILTVATMASLAKEILRDPTQQDWDRDPFETLAFLTGDRSQFVAEALDAQMKKRDFDDALVTSERMRRSTFFAQLPLGGRLMSIRYLLTSPEADLSPDLRRRQAEMRSRFPDLNQLLIDEATLGAALRRTPIQPTGEAELKAWNDAVVKWQAINDQIERNLLNVAIKRESIPLLFPPEVDLERVQKLMPEKTIGLVTIQNGNVYHVFLVTRDKIAFQASLNATSVTKAIRSLIKQWGHTNENAVLQTQVVQDQTWKKLAHQTLRALVPKTTPEFWDNFDEIVVIPDGLFWYLPFEALALEEAETSELLIDKVKVRYAPSLGLGFNEQRPRRLDRAVVYPGKIDLRDEPSWDQSSRTEIEKVWPGMKVIETSEVATSLVGPLVEGLFYFSEIRDPIWPSPAVGSVPKQELYRTLDLNQWPLLPNGGPDLLVVDGANSAIAGGLKGNFDGSELAYYSTLLMVSGCQSSVISRWRTGGHVPYDFGVKLIEELRTERQTAAALRNTMREIRGIDLDPKRQTRLRSGNNEMPIKAEHPFWWAGHMVIDRGVWYRDPVDPLQAEAPEGLLQPGGGEGAPAEMLQAGGGQGAADGKAPDPAVPPADPAVPDDQPKPDQPDDQPKSDAPKSDGVGKNDGETSNRGAGTVGSPPASGASGAAKTESRQTPPPQTGGGD